MDAKVFKCRNGATVKVFTPRFDVAVMAFKFYEENKSRIVFKCPFCENDDQWDNLTYERSGDEFEDTYTCDACDTLITITTPYGKEYHEVYLSETTYTIEFMWSGEPTTWFEDGDLIEPYMKALKHLNKPKSLITDGLFSRRWRGDFDTNEWLYVDASGNFQVLSNDIPF